MAIGFESGVLVDAQRVLRSAGRKTLDMLFPPLCAACRQPVADPHGLCARCWQSLSFLEPPACAVCGYPFDFDPGEGARCGACMARPPLFDRAISVLRYDDKSRDLILAFKRADRLDLAQAFAKWLSRVGSQVIADADVIVPVPLHPLRLWRRRFNQSAVLAHALGSLVKRPVDPFAVRRVRATPSQGEMRSAKARRRNMLGAFKVEDPARIRGKKVLLLDDVFTTGATLEACARPLKRAKADKVYVLTLARVVRPSADPI